MLRSQLLSAFAILALTTSTFAQTEVTVRDLETWSTVGLKFDLDKKSEFQVEQSLRLYDNSSKVDQFFTDVGFTTKLSEIFSLGFGARYIRNTQDDGDYENHLRFNADLMGKHSIERFSIKYRMRLQTKNELGFSKSEGDFLRNTFRLKAGVDYNIKNWKFDPEFSAEIFRESGRYMLSSFNKYRFTLGTNYKINKLMDLNLFYRFERELGVSYPLSSNIIGFKILFKL